MTHTDPTEKETPLKEQLRPIIHRHLGCKSWAAHEHTFDLSPHQMGLPDELLLHTAANLFIANEMKPIIYEKNSSLRSTCDSQKGELGTCN